MQQNLPANYLRHSALRYRGTTVTSELPASSVPTPDLGASVHHSDVEFSNDL